jgi:anti-sigma factor (TIGR02949 family)
MSTDKDHSHSHDIGCLAALEAFYAYLDGELDNPDSIADFEHHMSHCRSCFSRAEIERALTAHIRKSGKSSAPEALRSRLRNLIDKF